MFSSLRPFLNRKNLLPLLSSRELCSKFFFFSFFFLFSNSPVVELPLSESFKLSKVDAATGKERKSYRQREKERERVRRLDTKGTVLGRVPFFSVGR